MTATEAISRIKFLLDVGGSDGFTSSDKEALNTAINALSKQENLKTNSDKIRQMSDEELAESLSGSVRQRTNDRCSPGTHAHWVFRDEDKPLLEDGCIPCNMWCSYCGQWSDNDSYGHAYCHNCGSRMDEPDLADEIAKEMI